MPELPEVETIRRIVEPQVAGRTIRDIITWGIETDAMTPAEYLAGKGKEYRNTPDLRAYNHEGKPCLCCGHTMKRVTISGHSSCYCPYCQRKKYIQR